MTTIDNKKSFWSFLKDHKVEIPIIQRDYAQGREDEEDLRKKFLTDIRDALDGKLDGGKVLKLDFVYGSEDNGVVCPLDGQQRLTTLWLLHWYIAYKAKKIDEAKDVLKKFTYKTRDYSEQFCGKLSSFNADDTSGMGIAKHIENQSWFMTSWKRDPTIRSMLNMLGGTRGDDGIEDVFDGVKYQDFWEKLTNDDAPIVFYYLTLKDFGLSDDLYIKMNARGKPLTDLENFKADLITYLRKEEDKELYKNISARLDTSWTDIFWENKSDGNKIDEIYFAFLNRFFWNELFVAKKPGTEEDLICFEGDKQKSCNKGDKQESYNRSFEHLSKDYLSGYSSMIPYKFLDGRIPTKLFKDLQIVLDRYKAYMDLHKNFRGNRENPLSDLVSDSEWNSIPFPDILFPKWVRKDFEFIPKYKYGQNGEEISTLNPPSKRVMFYALCKYFTEEKTTEPPTKASFVALKQWMRVVCNLVSGRDTLGHILIRDNPTAKTAIKHIKKLDSQRVLEDLYRNQTPFGKAKAKSDIERQWDEEIIKAEKILDKDGKLSKHDSEYTWERIIIEAEEYAFFKGAIRFLFQGGDGGKDWDNFDIKLKHAKNYFKGEVKEEDTGENRSSCLKNNDEMKLLKALISKLDAKQFSNALFKNHKVFNNRSGSWRHYLLNFYLCAPIHELLLGHKDIENPLDREYLQEESCNIPPSTIKEILYLLSQTTLLNYIAENIPDAWIRDGYHNHCAIYRKKGGGVFLNAKGRDSFFKKNATKIKLFDEDIIIDNNIEGRYLLFGPNVYFDYPNDEEEKRVGHFLWYEDDYIYLQEPDVENRDISLVKDPNGKSPEQHWYCFDTKGLNETQIMEKLDELKGAYEKANPPSNS